METEKIYQDSYSFLLPYLKNTNDGVLISNKNYLLENLSEMEWSLDKYCLDILPATMPSITFFEEFDHDRDSTNRKWRENHADYFIKFRRFLYIILGYSQEIYIDTTTFDELTEVNIFKLTNTPEDMEKLEETIISSLNNFDNTILSLPQEKTLFAFSDLFIEVISLDQEMIDRMQLVATTLGLFFRKL